MGKSHYGGRNQATAEADALLRNLLGSSVLINSAAISVERRVSTPVSRSDEIKSDLSSLFRTNVTSWNMGPRNVTAAQPSTPAANNSPQPGVESSFHQSQSKRFQTLQRYVNRGSKGKKRWGKLHCFFFISPHCEMILKMLKM